MLVLALVHARVRARVHVRMRVQAQAEQRRQVAARSGHTSGEEHCGWPVVAQRQQAQRALPACNSCPWQGHNTAAAALAAAALVLARCSQRLEAAARGRSLVQALVQALQLALAGVASPQALQLVAAHRKLAAGHTLQELQGPQRAAAHNHLQQKQQRPHQQAVHRPAGAVTDHWPRLAQQRSHRGASPRRHNQKHQAQRLPLLQLRQQRLRAAAGRRSLQQRRQQQHQKQGRRQRTLRFQAPLRLPLALALAPSAVEAASGPTQSCE